MKFFIVALATIAAVSAAPGAIIGGIGSTISPLGLGVPIAKTSLLAGPGLGLGHGLGLGLNTIAAPRLLASPVAPLGLGLNSWSSPAVSVPVVKSGLGLGLNSWASPAVSGLGLGLNSWASPALSVPVVKSGLGLGLNSWAAPAISAPLVRSSVLGAPAAPWGLGLNSWGTSALSAPIIKSGLIGAPAAGSWSLGSPLVKSSGLLGAPLGLGLNTLSAPGLATIGAPVSGLGLSSWGSPVGVWKKRS